MLKIKNLAILICAMMVLFGTAVAQPEMQRGAPPSHDAGMVMGTITDDNGVPLEYATIYVKKTSDSLVAQYGITDSEGKFRIADIPFGNYFLEIQYMGYKTTTSAPFTITKEKAVFKIDKFKMSDKSTDLETVVIRAQRDMIQSNLDKTVYNVESSVSSAGQTAVEVLEEIPSVSVDIEGNVSLRGSENVTILVDGRPTNLTLDQIPADLIESIEVITNPSARLEPDGMAGILNVVLKKKKESGFNGMASIGASSAMLHYNDKHHFYFNGYNGSLSFNYRYNKINLFVSYGIRSFGFRNAGTMWRDSWYYDDTTRMEQSNYGQNRDRFHNVSASLDYYINKYNTITFNVSGHFGKMRRESELHSITYSPIDTFYYYDQLGLSPRRFNSFDASVNYKKTFKTQGMELTADLFYTQRSGDGYNQILQNSYLDIPDFYQRTETSDLNRDVSAQLDFVTPVGNGGRIETGYKFSYRGVGQDYARFEGTSDSDCVEDLSKSNDFMYHEYLNALYFIYSNTFWKKLKVQVGLRGEMSYTISDLKSVDTVYTYFNYGHFARNFFFPTVHIKYDITDNHALQFSFSRRVQRPRIHQLNPFVDDSDRENRMTGNPALEPEFANSFELGYMYSQQKCSFTFTTFYRRRTNLITRYTEILRDPETDMPYTMTSYQNLNKSQNFGVEVFFSYRVKKVYRMNITGSFYRNLIDSDNLLDENLSRDWAWNAGISQTFTLGKDFDLQLDFRYRSSTLTSGSMGWGTYGIGQGRRSANYRLNLGLKKGFLDNSLVVSLNIRNLLYFIPKVRMMEVSSWSGLDEPIGYESYSVRENSGFNISLNLTYKLNNYRNRPVRIAEDEYSGGEGDM
ncbi:MAG: TonB-dependent receptor [Bacteroidales bacterium]|nr:TonB-dependent receptor [Bacteroidales bacterium]